MAINQVKYGTTTLIDLTDTTATASEVLSGYSFHDKTGALVQGSKTIDLIEKTVTPSSQTQEVLPIGEQGTEVRFYCYFPSYSSTSSADGYVFTASSITPSDALSNLVEGTTYTITSTAYTGAIKVTDYQGGTTNFNIINQTWTYSSTNDIPFVNAGSSSYLASNYLKHLRIENGIIKAYMSQNQFEGTTTIGDASNYLRFIPVPEQYDGLSKVTVNGDADLIPSNIKKDVDIFGVVGTYEAGGSEPTYQTKTVTPTESQQTVSPDSGYDALSSVTVNAISSTYVGTGVTRKSAATITPGTTNQTIASGTYLTGTQTIAGDADLVASNIKQGVTIFGVEGTYAEDFIVTVTYNTTTQMYEPNCTFAELKAAYDAGKIIVAKEPNSDGNYDEHEPIVGDFGFVDNNSAFYYIVYWYDYSQTLGYDGYLIKDEYLFGASGLTLSSRDNYGNYTFATKTITVNGTYNAIRTDSVDGYSEVTVNVQPTLQSKTVTPTESSQTITPDTGYDGLDEVTVNAISSTYIGSDITQRSSTDLTASGATVTVPAGYYSAQATKSVASGSATVVGTVQSSPTITISNSGLITATNSAQVGVTPSVTAGYISSGTQGTLNIQGSNTQQLTTKAAATITPGTTNQTIAAGTYLTGTQTIVGDSDLVAENIKSGVQIFGVTGNLSFITCYTGTSDPSSSLGQDGDVYLKVSS